MVALLKTSAISGIEGQNVEVEVYTKLGQNKFTIIGLGDSAVKESRDRVTQAIRHLGYYVPNVVLVNLAPAEIRKEGASYDLAMALGILISSGQIKVDNLDDIFFYGELSLEGKIKPLRGVLSLAISAMENGAKRVVVPRENYMEASLVKGIEIIPMASLLELINYLSNGSRQTDFSSLIKRQEKVRRQTSIAEVYGQEQAKRALLIAAGGGHNVLMIGPPGCGKSMLANRFSSLLPALSQEECMEVVKLHSVAGYPIESYLQGERPYRNPHHVVSDIGLIGGGNIPRPGEISLAHHGVLFLDEFPEFRRSALESLRAPMESRKVQITRAKASYVFPANFQLIAAMNPCPCGRLGVVSADCLCSRSSIHAYFKKLSEPILDRIDMHVELDALPFSEFKQNQDYKQKDSTADLQAAVVMARERQYKLRNRLNAYVEAKEINKSALIREEALSLLEKASKQISLSARSLVRVLRVALTIADLEGSDKITSAHVAEALSFRRLDRLKQHAA